jgi:hypothetical protein
MTKGYSVFNQHKTEPLSKLKVWSGKIDPEDYELWRRDFVWEALHGQRYGQSFCNRFGLHDNHLFYNNGGIEWADNYIKKTYLA